MDASPVPYMHKSEVHNLPEECLLLTLLTGPIHFRPKVLHRPAYSTPLRHIIILLQAPQSIACPVHVHIGPHPAVQYVL